VYEYVTGVTDPVTGGTENCFLGDVNVLVNPRDPGDVTLPGENYLPKWVAATMIPLIMAASFVIFAGACLLVGGIVTERVLGRGPRRLGWVQAITVGSGDNTATFVLVERDGSAVVLKKLVRLGTPEYGRFEAEVIGTGRLVIRPLTSPESAMTVLRDSRLRRPRRMLVRGSMWSDDGFAVRLVGDTRQMVCRVCVPLSQSAVAALQAGARLDVQRGPLSIVVLRVVGQETPVLAERVRSRAARKKWPALASTSAR
jgi:hypothetical protein